MTLACPLQLSFGFAIERLDEIRCALCLFPTESQPVGHADHDSAAYNISNYHGGEVIEDPGQVDAGDVDSPE